MKKRIVMVLLTMSMGVLQIPALPVFAERTQFSTKVEDTYSNSQTTANE